MIRQISDLTSLVLALTEKISSTNREGNGLLTTSNAQETRSDENITNVEPLQATFQDISNILESTGQRATVTTIKDELELTLLITKTNASFV